MIIHKNKNRLLILCLCISISTTAQESCSSKTKVPVTGANSSAYPFGLIGSTIAINGNFTINNNFTITNKTLLMAPNTKIIVQSGKTLTITKGVLYSCGTDMWDGIEIQPGGKLIMSKTTVEDAKIAVLSDNNGGTANFSITSSIFNRNYIGVKVENYILSTVHPGFIRSTTFDSKISTIQAGNTPLLDAPYQNQTAETGIELNNVNSFLVGNTSNPAAKNNFKYLLKGIYGIKSNYTVYNNEFSDNAPKGWAIYDFVSKKTTVGGTGINQPNTFKNLYNGISHRSSSDLLVENNTFTNINLPNTILTGNNAISVYTFECNSATITLQRNQLSTVSNGFVHFKNADARYTTRDNTFNIFTGKAIAGIENNRGSIDVYNNSITGVQSPIYSGNTAVYVAGTAITFATSTVVNINNNTIGKINKGIQVIGTGRPIIERNTITFNANVFPTLTEFYFGIRTQNCAREEIHLNTLDKVGADPTASVVNALYGISVESSTNIPAVTENTVKKMGSGFRFRSFVGGAGFSCNTMTNNWFGLTLESANIGNQGAAPTTGNPNGAASDNSWTDPSLIGSPTAVKGLGTVNVPFYTRKIGYPWTPENPHITQSPLLQYTILTASNNSSFQAFIPQADELCQTICYDPTTCKIARLAKIARNENPFDQVLGNERFMMQEAVLRSVLQDSLVIDTTLQDGRDLQLFIDTLALTNVGKLVEVTTLLSRGDTLLAEALNLSINPKECADAYHKMVNEIYFRTWAKEVFEFTPTDSTVLYDIAVQDPLVCGTAIYNARVMMSIDVNDYSIDNGKRLKNKNDVVEKQVQQLPKGKLYPNPSQHTVNYEITLAIEQVGLLVFYDTMGKEVLASPLTTGNNKLTLDVSKLQNGLYLYKVFVNGKPQEMGKFIIQH